MIRSRQKEKITTPAQARRTRRSPPVYFEILAPSFESQRGAEQTSKVEQEFLALRAAARHNQSVAPTLEKLAPSLQAFAPHRSLPRNKRAAPDSSAAFWGLFR